MEGADNVLPLRKPDARRRRVSVATILAMSFGALVLASVGGVLALTVGANYHNTFDLLGKSANLLVDAMDDSLSAHMDRARDAVFGLAELYAEGDFEIDDSGAMNAALSGALVAAPDAAAILIYDRDGNFRGVGRGTPGDDNAGKIHPIAKQAEDSPEIRAALAQRERRQGLMWGDFALSNGRLYANASLPLVRAGVTKGWLVAPIDVLTLSTITKELSQRFETTAFIIDGDDRILAHPRLLEPRAAGWQNEPTVSLAHFDDPVLAHFGERRRIDEFGTSSPGVEFSEVKVDEAAGDRSDRRYILITKKIAGYGVRPWTIGAYFTRRELGDEIMRVWLSGAIGLAALAVALIAAILLGKRMARPIRAIAAQAHLVADFNLDDVKPLPKSRVLEFDDQAAAFNAMLAGLRAFTAYVPRSLVAKLVRTGDSDARRPREALVTVMFTDICGFTSISEQLPAQGGAELLNRQFAMQCEAIDAEGGTVDKFLGDGVMAFFGAPDRLKGHGAAAVRAAVAIREALEADNRAAVDEGRGPIRIRIGIHTGRVIVGDIGASDRVNYTIVGDTVNVSQRLQELGKLVAADAECAIVISGETATRLNGSVTLAACGKHRLRGRGEPVDVFLVETRTLASAPAEEAAQGKVAQGG
jgi:adenylate cyclase